MESMKRGIKMTNLHLIIGALGGLFLKAGPRPGSYKVMVNRSRSRPCLECGTNTKHAQPFCCAEHKRDWCAVNPGNGRYVSETWHDELKVQESGGSVTTLFGLGPTSPFIISTNTRRPREFKLREYGKSTVDQLFDCLIDAQRAASRIIRGVA